MSFADQIIAGEHPNLQTYLDEGNAIDDIDEYGFPPIIECAIAGNHQFAETLLKAGCAVDKPDTTGRTALHWAIDNVDKPLIQLLLKHGANPNAHNRGGQSALVYPLLRQQWELKNLLYQHGANLNFAMDFINTKLIGHRFQLKGNVDIMNANKEFIELDYEGFFLEFTLAIIQDSLQRFRNNYAAREYRRYFPIVEKILVAFNAAEELIKYQQMQGQDRERHAARIQKLFSTNLLILPIAYRGHALTMLRCGRLWAKVDRGENSLNEGSVNIYYINNPQALSVTFLQNLLYKKQTKRYIHSGINDILGLQMLVRLPISRQISGNCSWANVEATVPTAYMLMCLESHMDADKATVEHYVNDVMHFYDGWTQWDKDRALYECVQSFYQAENPARRATKVSTLAAVLFQSCKYGVERDMQRAEQILPILMRDEYVYVIKSYLETYASRFLTKRGNNLLQIMDDCGYNARSAAYPLPIKPIDNSSS